MLPLEYRDVDLSSPEDSPCTSPALTQHGGLRLALDDDDHASLGSPPLSPPDPPTSPRPTWPDPSAIIISTSRAPKTPSTTSVGAARRRSARSGGLIGKFEVNLADHLAEHLSGTSGQTLKSICEASGIKGELLGKQGSKKLVGWGSSSAVTKAKQLIDARLSQTPIRILLAVRLQSESSTLRLRRSPAAINVIYPLSDATTFHIVESAPLSPHAASAVAPLSPLVSTPASEKSESSFFGTSSSGTPSRPSSAIGDVTSTGLPSVGSWGPNKAAYIEAVVNELEGCVARSSLVKLKFMAGSQLFQLTGSMAGADGLKVTMEEVSRWKIDGAHRNLSPEFSVCLSRPTAENFKRRLVTMGLALSRETSQVHITHLDRRRAVYASATSDLRVRGGELKDNVEGTASGTLLLKKCSTLPSKPFSFSLTTPTPEIDPLSEGTDLRLKVLADKAATSPSAELSAAVQRASWDLDASGVFEVHLDLDPKRFTESETEIRWMAKSRYENDSVRATVGEVRMHGSKNRWYEVEFTSKKLNARLAELVQLRRDVDRREVSAIVDEFVEWCSNVVMPFKDDEAEPHA